MFQSCETLITKINKWQQAILELEKISDEFLDSGDEKAKQIIEDQKKEIEKQSKEYLDLAYPELPNGEKLFWPEKELLEENLDRLGITLQDFVELQIYPGTSFFKIVKPINIKDTHLYLLNYYFINLSGLHRLNLSLFQRLEEFRAEACQLKIFPDLPSSVKHIFVSGNVNIQFPRDLTNLKNLETFSIYDCILKQLPILPKSIEWIHMSADEDTIFQEDLTYLENLETFVYSCDDYNLKIFPKLNKNSIKEIDIISLNKIVSAERKKIKKEYANVKIEFS